MYDNDAVLERAASLKAAGQPFAFVTVVRCESPTSAKPGAKALITADGVIDAGWIGGGCAQPAVINTAMKCLKDGQPRYIRISPSQPAEQADDVVEFGMACHSGGTLDLFIDPVVPRPALLILGTSPAAQALCALAARVGFSVTTAFKEATQELFPDADVVLASLDVKTLKLRRFQFVVVATQGKRDEDALEAALGTDAGYIAFVASTKKAQKLREYLKERGHDRARVDAVISPAGMEIGAVTPEEIALSVLAGVVAARRGAAKTPTAVHTEQPSAPTQPGGTRRAQAPIEIANVTRTAFKELSARHTDPICGMSVDPATTEYSSHYADKSYYFCCAHCKHRFDQNPEKYAMPAVGAK